MKQMSRIAGAPGRAVERVGAALLLLVVVAAGVGSDVGRGEAPAFGWPVFALVFIAGAAAFGAVLVVLWAGGNAAFSGTSWRGKASVLGIGVVVVAGMVMTLGLLRPEYSWTPGGHDKRCLDGGFFWQHFPNRRDELFQDESGRFCWPSGAGGATGAAGGGGGDVPGALVAAAGGIVALIVVLATAAAIVTRRSRHRRGAPVEGEDPVARALDESLDDLRREQDVRRAIVACYARMEAALARAGRRRREHETPLEFLRRVLERVANEPGQVLTELFERARFSVEPMGEMEKRSAIAALEQLRAEVAAG